MRIPYNWLKDYVDVTMAPEKLAGLLTMSGFAVDSIEKTKDDSIFEIEVTSNRSDCFSVIGIAREVAAITGRKLKIPPLGRHCEPCTIRYRAKPAALPLGRQSQKERLLRRASSSLQRQIIVKIEDKKLCPRYTARIIRNVKVGESPKWLKTRIGAMGLKSVNNIVDITNFCLFETGEPMHAFDLDKISGKEISIRMAKKGEKITTIDGAERILESSDLVIADKDKPIAIAGIMGGKSLEVSNSTKNILLEAASFEPVSVRRASRRMALATESSYRFERRVSLENIVYASDRAAELISKFAGGDIGEAFDVGEKKTAPKAIELRYSRLNKILGLNIPKPNIKKILDSLGLKSRGSTKDGIRLMVPFFRNDLQSEIDIIEEVARIYGYGKIPETLPNIVESHSRRPPALIVADKIRQTLTGLGFDEIITYGLSSKKALKMSNIPDKNIVEIENPLSGDQDIIRPSLIAGLLNTMSWNINRKEKNLKLFELGNIYFKDPNGGFAERQHLSMGITGQIHPSWDGRSRQSWFHDLMGAFEILLSELGVDYLSYSLGEFKDARFSSSACASIEVKGESIGVSGEAAKETLDNFDIKDKAYALEIDVARLSKHISLKEKFKELPRYPSSFRDISIIVGKDTKFIEITSSIRDAAGPILRDVQLIDRYTGEQIPDGKISLTYRLEFQDLKKTLEEKDVSEAHNKILRQLEEKVGARPR